MQTSVFYYSRVNVSQRFGRVFMSLYLDHNAKWKRQISEQLSGLRNHGYKNIPSEVWIGATFENRPIVAMLGYVGHFEQDYIIVTRNE